MILAHDLATRTRGHMAKNLSPINAYPVESGMRKNVAIGLNVNQRYQMRRQNEHVVPTGVIFKIVSEEKT